MIDFPDVAPSFAEMDDAIKHNIEKSAAYSGTEADMQLSPAHQLVLNCIWLNFKVSHIFMIQVKDLKFPKVHLKKKGRVK